MKWLNLVPRGIREAIAALAAAEIMGISADSIDSLKLKAVAAIRKALALA